MPIWRLAATLAALAAYALLCHGLMAHAPGHPLTAAALFAPLLVMLVAAGLQRGRRLLLLAGALLAGLLAAITLAGRGGDMNHLYVLQHAGVHAALAWLFGSTLREGRTPLITALAQRIHREFTPAMRDYTRRLTALWAAYFVAMIVVSLAVYALAPWPWWSAFGNLLTPLAAGSFFVGEYLLRRWRHPEFERASLMQAVRAYREVGATRAPEGR